MARTRTPLDLRYHPGMSTTRVAVNVERWVHGGRAIARDERGRIVLVAGAIPGERVEVEIRERAGVRFGIVEAVLDPSPDRVAAPLHPGLDMGHVAAPRQLDLKRDALLDAAARSNVHLPGEPSVEPSPDLWNYRGGIQPATKGPRLGYRAEGSHDVVVLDDDPTAMPAIGRAWELLTEMPPPPGVAEVAMRGGDDGAVHLALVTTRPARTFLDVARGWVEAGVAGVMVAPFDPRGRFRSGRERLAGATEIRQSIGPFQVSVSATAFAQPNPRAAARAMAWLAARSAGGRRVTDLFGGSGTIGLHYASKFEIVDVIDVSREAIERGRRDAGRMGIGNVTFTRGDARSWEVPPGDAVIVDPPRAGLARGVREAIAAGDVREISYLSCDIATWARDAADLQARGFALTDLQPFDFMPHTHHLEIASRFERDARGHPG